MTGEGLDKVTEKEVDILIQFIRSTVEEAKAKGVVIGLSGGLDSVTVTKLCIDALGPKKVLNLFMPSVTTPPEDYVQTLDLSKKWGTEYKVVDIQPAVNAFTAMLFTNKEAPLERGNITARCRMTVLFNRAKKLNYLVVGTSNKSEFMTGYFTKYGDGASDLVPLVDVYKTQVWQLAKMIGVPKDVIDRVPTAGLWEGQTDEIEMGISYRDLDLVLNCIANGVNDEEISRAVGVSSKKVKEIRQQVKFMSHKRELSLRPVISLNK